MVGDERMKRGTLVCVCVLLSNSVYRGFWGLFWKLGEGVVSLFGSYY